MARKIMVWDPVVRLFHWSLVAAFAANVFFTRPGRDMHRYVGYAVAALIVLRLIWGLIGSKHARFADFPPSISAALDHLGEFATGRRNRHLGHSPLGALMIYNLILTFIGIAASGYAMTTVTFFGVDWVGELHEVLVTWAEISVVLHIGAVIFESKRLGVNLPRSMVLGYKTLD